MKIPQLTDADKAPHLATLLQDNALSRGLLGDLAGANYAKKGSCWGYGLTSSKQALPNVSQCGVFSDDNGNSITIVWDHRPEFATIFSQMKIKYDAVFLYSKTPSIYDTVGDTRSILGSPIQMLWNAKTTGNGWAEDSADAIKSTVIPKMLSVLQSLRLKNKNVAVVLHRENPFAWKDFAAQFITAVVTIAQFVPGMPKDVIAKAAKTLNDYLTTGRVSIDSVINCALALSPDSLRQNEYVKRATQVYTSVQKNDWISAGKAIGIDVPGLLKNFTETTDWTQIAKNAGIGFDGALSSLQNFLNADAVNKFAGGMKSGKIVIDLISGNTVTGVKEFQDAVLAGINSQTIMTMLPQPYALAQAIINETNDVTNSHEFRAILGLGNGIAVGDNVLDGLSIKSIASRVNDVVSNRYAQGIKDLQYALTTAIDQEKREYFATEVSKLTGAQILTNPKNLSVSSNFRKAVPYIAVGALAVGATYYYTRK